MLVEAVASESRDLPILSASNFLRNHVHLMPVYCQSYTRWSFVLFRDSKDCHIVFALLIQF